MSLWEFFCSLICCLRMFFSTWFLSLSYVVVTEWYRSGFGSFGYLLTLHKVGYARCKIFQSKLCIFYSLALPLPSVRSYAYLDEKIFLSIFVFFGVVGLRFVAFLSGGILR